MTVLGSVPELLLEESGWRARGLKLPSQLHCSFIRMHCWIDISKLLTTLRHLEFPSDIKVYSGLCAQTSALLQNMLQKCEALYVHGPVWASVRGTECCCVTLLPQTVESGHNTHTQNCNAALKTGSVRLRTTAAHMNIFVCACPRVDVPSSCPIKVWSSAEPGNGLVLLTLHNRDTVGTIHSLAWFRWNRMSAPLNT